MIIFLTVSLYKYKSLNNNPRIIFIIAAILLCLQSSTPSPVVGLGWVATWFCGSRAASPPRLTRPSGPPNAEMWRSSPPPRPSPCRHGRSSSPRASGSIRSTSAITSLTLHLYLSLEKRWSAWTRSYDLGYVLTDSHQSWYIPNSPRS